MESKLHLKYSRILEILPDVTECVGQRAILVGGTALALFHLKHRVSIDLDFATQSEDDKKLKEKLKGCLSKKGYKTARSAYQNQFIIQFKDTSIKIEVFSPEHRITKPETHSVSGKLLYVASIDDILELKKISYASRKEARDLFDIMHIMKLKKTSNQFLTKIIQQHGPPVNNDDIPNLANSKKDYEMFMEMIKNASKTGD